MGSFVRLLGKTFTKVFPKVTTKGGKVVSKGLERTLKPLKSAAAKNPRLAKVMRRLGIEGATMGAAYAVSNTIGQTVAYATNGESTFGYSDELEKFCALSIQDANSAQNIVNNIATSGLGAVLPDLISSYHADEEDSDYFNSVLTTVGDSGGYGALSPDQLTAAMAQREFSERGGSSTSLTLSQIVDAFSCDLRELRAALASLRVLEQKRLANQQVREDVRVLHADLDLIRRFIVLSGRLQAFAALTGVAIDNFLVGGPSVLHCADRLGGVMRSEGILRHAILNDRDVERTLDAIVRDAANNERFSLSYSVMCSDAATELSVAQPALQWLR